MLYLIKNVLLADGSGTPLRKADVAFESTRISAVEPSLPESSADEVFDGKGLVLCPGFIDVHSHSDISILAAPEATGKISQGVTTEIVGNCGLSVFPVTDMNREHLEELYRNYNEKISWNDLAGYAEVLEKRAPAVNVASLCGHNTLRAAVNGYTDKTMSADCLSECCSLLQASLDAGAAGLSTGLLYVPGKFAEEEELLQLLSVIAEFKRPYATHLRSESSQLLEAIQEAVSLCEKSGADKLHISHLKTAGKANWHKLDKVFKIIEEARKNGLELTADRYPYTESMTNLSVRLPAPYDDMDDLSLENLLRSQEGFDKLADELKNRDADFWQQIRVVASACPDFESIAGMNMLKASKITGTSPAELCARLLRDDAAGTMAAFKGMSAENLQRIIGKDFTCCGSDENARPLDYSIGRSHPRAFGSFPRFINMMKNEIGLEKTLAKTTSLPAKIFNLKDRGMIAPGFAADLVLLNPDKLNDRATFAKPHTLSEGIEKVWVNGALSYEKGIVTTKRSGRFLKIS